MGRRAEMSLYRRDFRQTRLCLAAHGRDEAYCPVKPHSIQASRHLKAASTSFCCSCVVMGVVSVSVIVVTTIFISFAIATAISDLHHRKPTFDPFQHDNISRNRVLVEQ